MEEEGCQFFEAAQKAKLVMDGLHIMEDGEESWKFWVVTVHFLSSVLAFFNAASARALDS